MEMSVQEHRKIIDAFRQRDADMAEHLVRKNAEYGGRALMQGVASGGTLPGGDDEDRTLMIDL
jgi:DNA-binding GntR family transcriptional regulator